MQYVNGLFWANNHVHVIQAKDKIASNKYLKYAISQTNIEPLLVGGGRAKLNANVMMDIAINTPGNIEEQNTLGTFINEIDNLITLHQRKYDKLVKIKSSLLEKMFPKNSSKIPEVRFKGFTEDWEQRKLSKLITEYKETVDSDCTLPVLTSSKSEGVIFQEEHFGRKQNHDITGYNILPRDYCTYRNRSDGVDFTFNINKCCDKGIISKFYPVFCGR